MSPPDTSTTRLVRERWSVLMVGRGVGPGSSAGAEVRTRRSMSTPVVVPAVPTTRCSPCPSRRAAPQGSTAIGRRARASVIDPTSRTSTATPSTSRRSSRHPVSYHGSTGGVSGPSWTSTMATGRMSGRPEYQFMVRLSATAKTSMVSVRLVNAGTGRSTVTTPAVTFRSVPGRSTVPTGPSSPMTRSAVGAECSPSAL